MRSSHAASSSSLKALPNDNIGTRCWCLASWLCGSAPTRCVGESGVRNVGCCSSSSFNSRISRSYSASDVVGASSTKYS